MEISKIVIIISKELLKEGARTIVVGGSVRDYFLNLPIKDCDIEVYGLDSLEQLERILKRHGSVSLVGKSFGVFKFVYENKEYDFSFPRTEKKISRGHSGFKVSCNSRMGFRTASIRRDFTINAMGYDVEKGCFLDPFNAKKDIKERVLRHINDKTFIEDPLRVYRAVQFCARFEYKLADETFSLCKEMVSNGSLEELPKERIYTEFKKLLLKSSKPSIGLNLMKDLGILKYFPELEAIVGVPQNPFWHPEGDVWTHTLMAVDKMVGLRKSDDDKENLKLMFAILCHDFGKATHTRVIYNKIRSIGHEVAGVEPTKKFLYRLTNEHNFIKSILPLVEFHMKPTQYFYNGAKNKAIRKLSTKVNIEELVTVARADFLGRTTEASSKGIYEAGDWLLKKARELNVSNQPLKPLIRGRDLIDLGLKPSKKFKMILSRVYTAQLEGRVETYNDAMRLLKNNII